MAVISNIAPDELETKKTRREYYYPAARVDFQISFENYDALNPDQPRAFGVLPKSLTIHRNSYKQADTFQVAFDAAAFPCTPDAIRAGALEIRLFQTEGAFEQATDLATLSVYGVEPSIVGLFDQNDVEYSESGREVTISGTDYTSLFTSKKWPDNKRIKAGLTLQDTLTQLMDEVPGTRVTQPQGSDNPYTDGRTLRLVVEPLGLLGSLPTLGAAEGRTNTKNIKVAGETYWDVMYNLAVRYGYIIFVRGLDVVLTTAKAYEVSRNTARALAWGENVTSLRMSRKMAKERTPVIEVRSYDDKTRQVIKAQYPKSQSELELTDPKLGEKIAKKQQQASKSTQLSAKGSGGVDVEYQVYTLPGIKEKAVLQRAAENIYYLRSRGEMEINVVTRDLRDLDGKDMLDLSSGDAVTLAFNPFSVDLLESKPFSERITVLRELGYPQEVATKIATAIEKTNIFKHPLRVREVTFEWEISNGLTISLQLQNFVNIDLIDKVA